MKTFFTPLFKELCKPQHTIADTEELIHKATYIKNIARAGLLAFPQFTRSLLPIFEKMEELLSKANAIRTAHLQQQKKTPTKVTFSSGTTTSTSTAAGGGNGIKSGNKAKVSSSSRHLFPSSSPSLPVTPVSTHTYTSVSSAATNPKADQDNEYRDIVKALAKSAKNYKIKELNMHPNPVIRREKFSTWIIDLRNILSTHHKTAGILDSYPEDLEKFDPVIDRAMQTLLFSTTNGMTKRLISSANTAYKALFDLRRNFGQTDRKSTRLNSSHSQQSRMPSSA